MLEVAVTQMLPPIQRLPATVPTTVRRTRNKIETDLLVGESVAGMDDVMMGTPVCKKCKNGDNMIGDKSEKNGNKMVGKNTVNGNKMVGKSEMNGRNLVGNKSEMNGRNVVGNKSEVNGNKMVGNKSEMNGRHKSEMNRRNKSEMNGRHGVGKSELNGCKVNGKKMVGKGNMLEVDNTSRGGLVHVADASAVVKEEDNMLPTIRCCMASKVAKAAR